MTGWLQVAELSKTSDLPLHQGTRIWGIRCVELDAPLSSVPTPSHVFRGLVFEDF